MRLRQPVDLVAEGGGDVGQVEQAVAGDLRKTHVACGSSHIVAGTAVEPHPVAVLARDDAEAVVDSRT
jgi:hypothetical protein